VPRLVLASGSPRRHELLGQLGVEFTAVAPNIDETRRDHESPADYVRRLAIAKAEAVPGEVVIGADTCVELGGVILGKPVDGDDARRMLATLSGRSHHVHTGLAVRYDGVTRADVCTTLVTFAALSAAQIEAYVATGEPLDKAGGYALQGAAGAFVPFVRGSVSNVVGLPLHTLAALLPEGLSALLPRRRAAHRGFV